MHRFLTLILTLYSFQAYASQPPLSLSDIYAVHCSKILPKNNIKFAGNQLSDVENGRVKRKYYRPRGTTLQQRITLHHCLGGVVPEEEHGVKLSLDKSYIHTDKNVFAFIEPLSAFVGEAYGGKVTDFFSIDQHYYGAESVLILPGFLKKEFETGNPTYQGQLILFNPYEEKLTDLVKNIIRAKKGLVTEDLVKLAKEPYESNRLQSLFQKYNFTLFHEKWGLDHSRSCFIAFEETTSQINNVIESCMFPEGEFFILKPLHYIRQRVISEFFMQEIVRSLEGRLNEAKIKFLEDWQKETQRWFDWVAEEIHLRENVGTSKVKDYEPFVQFAHENKGPMRVGSVFGDETNFFGEGISQKMNHCEPQTIRHPFVFNSIYLVPLSLAFRLYDYLYSRDLKDEAELFITQYHFWNYANLNFYDERPDDLLTSSFLSHLKRVFPSEPAKKELEKPILKFLEKDTSLYNSKALKFLNDPIGKAVRSHFWGNDKDLTFLDLLKFSSKAKIAIGDTQDIAKTPFGSCLIKYLVSQLVTISPPVDHFREVGKDLTPYSAFPEENYNLYVYNFMSALDCADKITTIVNSLDLPLNASLVMKLIDRGLIPSLEHMLSHVLIVEDVELLERLITFLGPIFRDPKHPRDVYTLAKLVDLSFGYDLTVLYFNKPKRGTNSFIIYQLNNKAFRDPNLQEAFFIHTEQFF